MTQQQLLPAMTLPEVIGYGIIYHQLNILGSKELAYTYAPLLAAYAEKFRERSGIEAMVQFIFYCAHNDVSDLLILETILHDLSDQNDPMMEPRTIGYLHIDKAVEATKAARWRQDNADRQDANDQNKGGKNG